MSDHHRIRGEIPNKNLYEKLIVFFITKIILINGNNLLLLYYNKFKLTCHPTRI